MIIKDENLIVSGSDDNTLRLWGIMEERLIKNIESHVKTINTVAITQDNSFIISGSDDNTIKF